MILEEFTLCRRVTLATELTSGGTLHRLCVCCLLELFDCSEAVALFIKSSALVFQRVMTSLTFQICFWTEDTLNGVGFRGWITCLGIVVIASTHLQALPWCSDSSDPMRRLSRSGIVHRMTLPVQWFEQRPWQREAGVQAV